MSEVDGSSRPWMIQLMGYPNWKDVKWRNVAKGGETITQQLNGFDQDVLPVLQEPRCNRIYFFHWEKGRVGTFEGNHALLRSLWAKARAKGAIVVVFTDTPTASGGMPTVRNDLIRDDLGTHYDILVDVATIPELQNPADSTYYRSDGVHLDTLGFAKVAELINRTIIAP